MKNSLVDVSFRPARAQDKARVLEITAHTWGDGDYIAEVWEDWLADPQGELTVAELGGQVVALFKLTVQSPGQMWLEGLRVDPNRRKQGIATAMFERQLDLARKLGGQVVRYSTGHDNAGSHHLAAKLGFCQVAAFQEMNAEPDPAAGVQVLAMSDWPALQAVLAKAVFLRMAGNLYEYNWKWHSLTAERLQAHLAAGQVVGTWQPDGRLAAWAIIAMPERSEHVHLHWIEGEASALVALAGAVRGRAAQAAKTGVEAMVFKDESMVSALDMASYKAEPWVMHVFEKQLL